MMAATSAVLDAYCAYVYLISNYGMLAKDASPRTTNTQTVDSTLGRSGAPFLGFSGKQQESYGAGRRALKIAV